MSEGITVPSMENPPASQIVGGGVPIAMVGWDSLSANWQGNTMVQAGWYWESGLSNPLVWWEFVYPGQSSSTNHIMPISGQTSHPVHFGDYMYVYINENSTSQYYVLISDITNGIDYSAQVTTSAYTFTPYYFGSIIEAPEYGSTYAQIPEFSNFQVNSLSFYSNGNTLLYGSTEYSASNYYYFYLQQSSNGQNINNQFSTSGDGYYNVGWANSYYSASYISSH